MTNKEDLIKNKTATIRCNEDLLQKFYLVKDKLQEDLDKEISDGVTWIECLKLALSNPIDSDLLTLDKNVNIKRQIRVNNTAIKDIGRLKEQLSQYKTIKTDVEVWRYCLKLAYNILVGADGNVRR